MGVPDPLCLFWGGVSLGAGGGFKLDSWGICHPWHLGPFHSGPETHLCGHVFNCVSLGETHLPVVTGVVVGDGKSGGKEVRGSGSFPEAVGMQAVMGHPVAHGGAGGVV